MVPDWFQSWWQRGKWRIQEPPIQEGQVAPNVDWQCPQRSSHQSSKALPELLSICNYKAGLSFCSLPFSCFPVLLRAPGVGCCMKLGRRALYHVLDFLFVICTLVFEVMYWYALLGGWAFAQGEALKEVDFSYQELASEKFRRSVKA